MTNENQSHNPESSRLNRFREAFQGVFSGMAADDERYLAENSKMKYEPSPEIMAKHQAELRKMVWEQRASTAQTTETAVVQPLELTAHDHQDLEWLHADQRTGSEVVQAIDQSKQHPEQ